jgi:hypothetical protein
MARIAELHVLLKYVPNILFRLGLSVAIKTAIVLFELAAGLLSEAVHNASIVLSFWSDRLEMRSPTGHKFQTRRSAHGLPLQRGALTVT